MDEKFLFEGITQESRMIRFRRILCGHQKFGEFETSVNQFFTRFEKEYEYLITIKQVQRMFEILREKNFKLTGKLKPVEGLKTQAQASKP